MPVRILIITTLFSLFLAGCSSSCSEQSPATQANPTQTVPQQAVNGDAAPQTVERIPSGPWTDLAKRLVESKDLEGAVSATREALARGGVATFDGTRALID